MDDPVSPELKPADDELRQIEAEVFGPDAPRKPDGTPLELGHGSNYSKASPEAKARYHALLALKASEDEVAALTQQLENAKTTRETHRLAIKAAAAQTQAELDAAAARKAEADALAAQAGRDAEAAQQASLKAETERADAARADAERTAGDEQWPRQKQESERDDAQGRAVRRGADVTGL